VTAVHAIISKPSNHLMSVYWLILRKEDASLK